METTEYPGEEWGFAVAAYSGWSVGHLEKATAAAREFGSRAAVVVHRGRVVAHGGDIAGKTLIRSVRKSLLSALIGIEVERGRIRLGDTMAELGIDDVPPALTDKEKEASVADLLKSRSGIYHPALAESAALRAGKPPRGSHRPGSHWSYNNWDFNALGTIYERAAGHSVFEGFYREIARPIGMQDFQPDDGEYLHGPESMHPAYHFRMSARDLARFGLLYLNGGRWKDKQIVSGSWVRESTEAHSMAPTGDGYGYMWWTTGHDGEAGNRSRAHLNAGLPKFRYFAQGYGGQMIGVLPAKDVVIVNLASGRDATPAGHIKLGDFVRLVAKAAPY